MTAMKVVPADVVIVGGGAAGLAAALGCRGLDVRVLARVEGGADGSTAMAQGGIAAAIGDGDSTAAHAADTVAAAAGLADRSVVDAVTAAAPEWIWRLEQLGARFDRGADGALSLGREAAHSAARIVHASGDRTGAMVARTLGRAVAASDHVTVAPARALDLVVRDGRVAGVEAEHDKVGRVIYSAPAVVLATGGIGQVFADTTNPSTSTGDGLAMAARAGAKLIDLEFVQFHPTALAVDRDPRPLLTEALRGAGALLVDEQGRRFMTGIDERAELAPRDIVARAIARQLEEGHEVYLDARSVAPEDFPTRFPTAFSSCREHGLDPRRDLLPVRPAAHYHMGGVATDLDGRTSLAGLWAAGEVASTGLHGGNRLASNSLLECLVAGDRVAADLVARAFEAPVPLVALPASADFPARDFGLEEEIRALASQHLGVIRSASGLDEALTRLARLEERADSAHPTTRNLWTVASLVAAWARRRAESRGSHFRRDRPASVAEDEVRWAGSMATAPWQPEFEPHLAPSRSVAVGR